jgi:hypothetical protein
MEFVDVHSGGSNVTLDYQANIIEEKMKYKTDNL